MMDYRQGVGNQPVCIQLYIGGKAILYLRVSVLRPRLIFETCLRGRWHFGKSRLGTATRYWLGPFTVGHYQ